MTNSQKRGFTLIELLVVISIISLLSSIVLASLTTAKKKATNAQTIAQVKQYQTALTMYYLDTGGYPMGNPNSYYCLGGGAGNKCFFDGYSIPTLYDSNFYSTYMKKSTNLKPIVIGSTYQGIVYSCTNISNGKCTAGAVYWPLEATSCPIGGLVAGASGNVVCGQDAGGSTVANVGGDGGGSTPTDGCEFDANLGLNRPYCADYTGQLDCESVNGGYGNQQVCIWVDGGDGNSQCVRNNSDGQYGCTRYSDPTTCDGANQDNFTWCSWVYY
jgi:prepilin-type N-terminal cleavage/methylation domain-containing protein